MVKKVLMVLFSVLFLLPTASGVQARELESESFFERIPYKSEFLEGVAKEVKGKELVSSEEVYINFETTIDKDGETVNTEVKEYSEEEYKTEKLKEDLLKKENIKSKINDIVTMGWVDYSDHRVVDGWIRLTINAYGAGGYDMDLYGFFEWLSMPYTKRTEIMSLVHDSNVTFTNKSAWFEYYYFWQDGLGGTDSDWEHHDSASSDFQDDNGGVAFTFDAPIDYGYYDNGAYALPYGVIYVPARASQTSVLSSNCSIIYVHQSRGLEVTPTIGIPIGASSLTLTYEDRFEQHNFSSQLIFAQ